MSHVAMIICSSGWKKSQTAKIRKTQRTGDTRAKRHEMQESKQNTCHLEHVRYEADQST